MNRYIAMAAFGALLALFFVGAGYFFLSIETTELQARRSSLDSTITKTPPTAWEKEEVSSDQAPIGDLEHRGEISRIPTLDFDPVARLQALGIDTSFDNLVSLVNDESSAAEVQYLSLIAIGQSGRAEAFDILASKVSSPTIEVEIGVARGLVELNDFRAVPVFGQWLTSDSPSALKQSALIGLMRDNSDAARDALVVGVQYPDQDRDVVVTIIEALSQHPSAQADALFQSLLTASDAEIRGRSAIFLSKRYGSAYDSDLVSIALDTTLPAYIWVDVVKRIEVTSGVKFDGFPEGGRAFFDPGVRKAVNEQVMIWQSSRD